MKSSGGLDSLRASEKLSQRLRCPILQLLDRSGAATGDLAHLASGPTSNRPQDHHFALVVRKLVEELDQVVQSDHGEGLSLDIDAGWDQFMGSGVDRVFTTSRPTPDLVDSTGPRNGEHPCPETAGVPSKVADSPGDLEKDITDDIFGVGQATCAKEPQDLWGEPGVDEPPCSLISGSSRAEMGTEVTVLHVSIELV
jgi:hypothetical protein